MGFEGYYLKKRHIYMHVGMNYAHNQHSFTELQGFTLQYKERPAEACANVIE